MSESPKQWAVVRLTLGEALDLGRAGRALLVHQRKVLGAAEAADPPVDVPGGATDGEIAEAWTDAQGA